MPVKDRLHEKKFSWHIKQTSAVKSKPYGSFAGHHFRVGTQSKHRLDGARKLRCLIRLKMNRDSI